MSQAKDENEYTDLSIRPRRTFMFSMEEWFVHHRKVTEMAEIELTIKKMTW